MPIDARIPLGVQPVQMPDFAKLATQRAAIQNSMADMASKQRAMAEQNTMANILQDPGFSWDDPQQIQRLTSYAPTLGPAAAKSQMELRKAQAEQAKFAREEKTAIRDTALQRAAGWESGADIKASLDQDLAEGKIAQADYDTYVTHIPKDDAKIPAFTNLIIRQLLTPEQVIADDNTDATRTQSAAQASATLAEQTRNNKVTSGISQQNANTSQRNSEALYFTPPGGDGAIKGVDKVTGEEVSSVSTVPKPTAGATAATKADAIEKFNTSIGALRGAYVNLANLDALVSSSKKGTTLPLSGKVSEGVNVFSNVARYTAASDIGQKLEGAIGSEAQTERGAIANLAFQMINALKNIQGVGAKSLDSNVELKNALLTLAKPSQSEETIARTLDTLEKVFTNEIKKAEAEQAATVDTATDSGVVEFVRKPDGSYGPK